MNTLKLLILIISLTGSPLFAQVIGDDALKKVQQGEVSFLEGQFVANLSDTVSPGFVNEQITSLGYEIVFSDIVPVTISIVNSPDDSVINTIRSYPGVLNVYLEDVKPDTNYARYLLDQQSLSEEEFNQAMNRITNNQRRKRTVIEFNYPVNSDSIKAIMGNFRSVAYQFIKDYPRSVNIKTEPGNEEQAMARIEELPFVESTALIGVISD